MNNLDYLNGQQSFSTASAAQAELSMSSYLSKTMQRIFGKMFMGILVTAFVSLGIATTPSLLEVVFSSKILFFGLIFAQLGLVIWLTAGTFGAMAIYGYVTKKDITKMGSILVMALIGLIIVSVVNIFLASSALAWGISAAGVIIFIGLTAWDVQKIKQMAMETSERNVGKLAAIGALTLYLDFINLFLYLLRIFGNRD